MSELHFLSEERRNEDDRAGRRGTSSLRRGVLINRIEEAGIGPFTVLTFVEWVVADHSPEVLA
ncbi:MAG: hypothetical protein QXP56_04905 [Archaeoglobaceae archaeon]